jgi:hypothetical protein
MICETKENIIGWSPRIFIDLGNGTWRAEYGALVGDFYMIDQKLWKCIEVVSRHEEKLSGEHNNIVDSFAYAIVRLNRAGTATNVTLIENQLKFFFLGARLPYEA